MMRWVDRGDMRRGRGVNRGDVMRGRKGDG